MRPIEALALAVTVMSCSPPPSPAETPAITPSASASIAPTASHTPAIAVAPAEAVARPKDWMWEVLGSTRAVHLRARTADGSVACERYRLEPTGLPASFQGTLVLDDDAQPLRVEATYEGNPPQLSAGCASVTSREAREGARRMLAGETRLALVTRLATAKRIWRGASCEETFVREGKEPSFSGAAATTASLIRAGKPVFLFVETARDDYPSFLRSGASGSLIVEETSERNPHRVFKHGAGDIAIGCCGSVSYDVLDVTPERARLRARRGPRDSGTRPLAEVAWFFEKAACELGARGR